MSRVSLFVMLKLILLSSLAWIRLLTIPNLTSAIQRILLHPQLAIQIGLGVLLGGLIGWSLGSYFICIIYEEIAERSKLMGVTSIVTILISVFLWEPAIDNSWGLRSILPFVSVFVVTSPCVSFISFALLAAKRARVQRPEN